MPRVGILSMQRILNYGSFLQAYGLKSILEELGCDVEFVDYHPGKCLLPVENESGISRKIAKGIEVLKQKAPITEKIRFIQYKRQYAAKYYPYLGIGDKMNYAPELDVLVIGSDEVFNCVQNNMNVGFSPELFGVGNNAKKVISYSASFGNTTLEKLKKYKIEDKISVWIKRFDAISVRDSNSSSIINSLIGIEPYYHLDPVLIYDFIGKCNNIPSAISEKQYMILYGYSGRFSNDECRKIRTYADRKGLKVLCIGGVQDTCDEFIDCNPFKVISYFQHADSVVTDTFHGTIMSIITHKPFVSVIRNFGYGNSEKMTDLLNGLGLFDRAIDDLIKIEEIINRKIDYKKVDMILDKERIRSYLYLKQQIEV